MVPPAPRRPRRRSPRAAASEGFPLGRRQPIECLLEAGALGGGVRAPLGQRVDEDLARRAHPAPPEMIDQDVAHDREEPRLEGPGRIIGVPGVVRGHERVLEDILALVRVSDPPAEKALDREGLRLQERTIGLAVPTLRTLHPLGPFRAVGSEGLLVHS